MERNGRLEIPGAQRLAWPRPRIQVDELNDFAKPGGTGARLCYHSSRAVRQSVGGHRRHWDSRCGCRTRGREGCQNLCSAPNPSFDTLQGRCRTFRGGVLSHCGGDRTTTCVRAGPDSTREREAELCWGAASCGAAPALRRSVGCSRSWSRPGRAGWFWLRIIAARHCAVAARSLALG